MQKYRVIITESLNKLMAYIENENYRGYDPYDALKSPLFKLPVFRKNKFLRFATQQLVKRSPINLRLFLLVPKGLNPVTLGLCIQTYTYLSKIFPDQGEEYLQKINDLILQLESLIPKGYSGACWGYDFPWEARYSRIPAFQPTVVATGIITNGLYECFKITGNLKALDLCKSASNFILKDLNRIQKGNLFCFSYSPFDRQQVFNACMKAVRLLSQMYSITLDKKLLSDVKPATTFIINNQKTDGAWIYGLKSTTNWIDNYHTGYVLDCLYDYQNYFNDNSVAMNIKQGYSFYKDNFITKDGIPKFYHNSIWPIDCTAGSQTILTLTRFGDIDIALHVASWLIRNMQNKSGYFYYRKYRLYSRKTSFMRWSNAWMAMSLSYLLYKLNSEVSN